jgi:hypothetical protein
MATHLSTIAKLREAREEATDPAESDYSEDALTDDGFETDGSDEDEAIVPSGADPASDTVMMLPSLFASRPATVFFDYPVFMDRKRSEGRDRAYTLPENDKMRPLHFRSNHTIICLGGSLKRSGFKRLVSVTHATLLSGYIHLSPSAAHLEAVQIRPFTLKLISRVARGPDGGAGQGKHIQCFLGAPSEGAAAAETASTAVRQSFPGFVLFGSEGLSMEAYLCTATCAWRCVRLCGEDVRPSEGPRAAPEGLH